MRIALISLAVLIFADQTLRADSPARLGVPIGTAPKDSTLAPAGAAGSTGPAPEANSNGVSGNGTAMPGLLPALPAAFGAADGAPAGMPAAPLQLPTTLPATAPPAPFPPPSNMSRGLPPGAAFVPAPMSSGAYPPSAILPGTLPAGMLPPGAMQVGATTPGATAAGAKQMPGATMPVRNDLLYPGPPPFDPNQRLHGTGPCGPIGEGLGTADVVSPFTENLSFFLGLDGAREPLDLGINARFGYRFHINWGLPLVEEWRLGLHLGTAYNFGHNAIRVLRVIEASRDIHQFFFTVGLFQRRESGLNWEIAWDFRNDDYYEHISASQWRGLLSYYVNERNEVGLWGTLRDRVDRASVVGNWFNVRPINQINLFWRHTWDMQITTGFWAGIAEEHGRFVLINPGEPAVRHPFIFGCDLFVPLSDRLAIFGEAQFITPNDSGTVVATLGVAWYPSGRPAAQPRGAYAPLLPVANNTSFSLDVQQ